MQVYQRAFEIYFAVKLDAPYGTPNHASTALPLSKLVPIGRTMVSRVFESINLETSEATLIPTYSYIQRYEKPGMVKLTSQISLPKCFQSGNLNNASNCSFRIKCSATFGAGKKCPSLKQFVVGIENKATINGRNVSLRKHWEGQEDISIWTFSRRSRLYSVERAIPKIFTCPRGRPRTYSDEESGRVASISFSSGRSNQPRVTKLPAVGRTPESSLVTNPDLLSQPPVEEKSVDLESTVESDSFRYHNIKFSRIKFTAGEGV
ncbi:hypothetical protein V1477_005816 [Vespula maculifrons]|uniref:Uncharacterized protein n=1 Tax=Vespula maculifrons TaxID=7453 RepID=A0ABD2CLB3_VESMC